MDSVEQQDQGGLQVEQTDLSGIDLPVLSANQQELAAHNDAIQQIDKATGGKAVWQEAA